MCSVLIYKFLFIIYLEPFLVRLEASLDGLTEEFPTEAQLRQTKLFQGLQHCPNCGAGELKIIAAILERPAIEKILTHLGIDPQPPPRGRAREAGQDFPA